MPKSTLMKFVFSLLMVAVGLPAAVMAQAPNEKPPTLAPAAPPMRRGPRQRRSIKSSKIGRPC